MKILQSCGSRSWGGLEMQALMTSVELRRRGHDVSLLCLPRTALLKEAYSAGVPAVSLLGEDRNAFATIKDLSKLFRSYNYDVVHTHLSHDLWWIVPAMKLASSDARLFLTKHMASGVKKTDPLHKFLYARLQGTFAISNYIKGSVMNTCPVPESDVHVIPPGISLEVFDPALYNKSEIRRELGIPGNAILVGMVGRMTPGKGHKEFLRAAAELVKTSDMTYQFIVVGEASEGEESYAANVRQLASELGVGDVVRFTGFVKDIPRILAALDILAFPSHEESFGLGLTEAMAMKIPVVASRSAGVPDIVVDGETGMLVPPKEYAALAAGISDLAHHPELRRRFGEAGRERAERFFGIKSVVDRLESHYSEGPVKQQELDGQSHP
jgi:glycosyltransferase involved in cell wall biosynthesis